MDDQNNLRGWEIIKEDGTIYRFGNYDLNIEEELKFPDPNNSPYEPTYATRYRLGYIGESGESHFNHLTNKADNSDLALFPTEWDLSTIEDIYGNITTIYYQPELKYLENFYGKSDYPYTQTSYIKKIVDFRGRSIEFILDSMEVGTEYIDFNSSISQQNYSTQYLKYIKMFSEEGNLIKQYELMYTLEDLLSLNQTKRFLVSIVESFPNGELKKTSFNYYGVNGQNEGENLGALKEIIYPTGGTVEYEYQCQKINNVILDKEESYSSDTYPVFDRNKLEKIGFTGVDFKVIQLNDNTLQVFRWGTKGWYLDTSFPNNSPITKYWVFNDYIVVKEDGSMSVYKRNEDDWDSFEIDVDGIEDAEVIGLGADFFVIKHDKKIINSEDKLLEYTMSVIRWATNTWKIDSNPNKMYYYIHEDDDLNGRKRISCSKKFFYEEYLYDNSYMGRTWFWNGETWINSSIGNPGYGEDGGDIIPYTGKDYTIAYLPNYINIYGQKEPIIYVDNFGGIGAEYHNEKAELGIYTGEDFFVTLDNNEDNNSTTIKVFTYIGQYDWNIKNIQDFFQNDVEFKNAKIAIDNNFFVIGWITDDAQGRLDFFKLNSGYSWIHDGYKIIEEDLSTSGSYVLPILTMDQVLAEIIVPNKKHKLLALIRTKTNTDGWMSEVLLDESNYLGDENSFTQAGNNFIASINKPTSSPIDIKSYSFKQGYGQNAEPIYQNSPWDYPLYKKTISDKNGVSSTYTYEFINGVYDASINFAKYNKVVINEPSNSGKIVYYFYNDLGAEDTEEFVDVNNFQELDGSPYLQKVYDANNNCISEKKYIWNVVDKGDGCFLLNYNLL